MTHPMLQELEDLRSEIRGLRQQIPKFRTLTVGAADQDTNTVVLEVPDADDLAVQPEWSGFFPAVGDEVDVEMRGATPVLRPGRIGAGAVGDRELAEPVKKQIVDAYEAANGKNKVFFSTLDPAAAGVSGTVAGDVFFQKDIYGLGVIVGSWEWGGSTWVPKFFGDSVLNSLTVGKIVGGTATFDMLMAGSMYSSPDGSRYRIDATGIRLYSGADPVPTVDLDALTGIGTLRRVVLEGALFRTKSAGQRFEIESGGAAGGRTLSFYPAGNGLPARVLSRDDEFGNAGITMEAGGATRGFVNFTSTFADIGFTKPEGSSFVRVGDSAFGVQIGVEAGRGMSIATTAGLYMYSGATMFARLSGEAGLERVSSFALDGAAGSFTFGLTAGQPNADVYALRFISTNPGATGGFIYFSDKRLKRNSRAATFDALADVLAMPVREFEWNSTGEKSFGFMAQDMPADVQVQLSPDSPVDGIDNPVGVASELVVAKLVKAVQQLNDKVESIRGRAK